MTFLLIIDCVIVFYGFFQYITGTIHSVLEIASVYTNKNMLTAAIFIKIPFAIYLLLFSTYRWKNLLFGVLFCAFLAIFLLSTRAFYLGLFITSFLFICYLLILLLKNKRKDSIVIGSGYIIALLFALIIHTLIATYLLPKNDASIYNKTLTSRMETLEREYDQGSRKRAWLHSYYL